MKRYKISILLSAFVVILGLVSSVLAPTASAIIVQGPTSGTCNSLSCADYEWVNESTISVTYSGQTLYFYDSDGIQNHRPNVTSPFNNGTTCQTSTLQADSTAPDSLMGGTIYTTDSSSNSDTCNPNTIPNNTPIGSASNATIIYTLSSDNKTIMRMDGNPNYTFTQSSNNSNVYLDTVGGGSCPDAILLGSNGSAELFELTTPSSASVQGGSGFDSGKAAPASLNESGCDISQAADDINGPAPAPSATTSTYGSSATVSSSKECMDNPGGVTGGGGLLTSVTCSDYSPESNDGYKLNLGSPANDPFASTSSSSGGQSGSDTVPGTGVACSTDFNPLTWFICPVIDLINGATDEFAQGIESLLDTNLSQYTTKQPAYQAWDSIRLISLVLLVILALIMVISQAISVGPFDAYTIRKVLPKLLISIIFITLSWDIARLLISYINDLGDGIGGLILSPFSGQKIVLGSSTLALGSAADAAGLGIGIVGVMSGLFSIGIVISLALTIVVSVLSAFIVLILRQILILALVIFSPIAILAWVLPGTEKLWKLWWSNFIKALLMYPLIVVLISAGEIFGLISDNSAGGTKGSIYQIIAIVAVYLPYFLIPTTFKMSGSAMSFIGDRVGKVSSGINERNKKYRQHKLEQSAEKFRSREGLRANGMGEFVKRTSKGLEVGYKGRYGFGGDGSIGQNALAQLGKVDEEKTLKANPRLRALAITNEDGNLIMALGGTNRELAEQARADARQMWIDSGSTEAEATDRADRAFNAASAIGWSEDNQIAALATLGQNKSRPVSAGRFDIIQRGIDRVAGNNGQLADDLAYNFQYNSRNAGRDDLGGSWHDASLERRAQMRAEGYIQEGRFANNANGRAQATREALAHETMLDGVGRTGISAVMRGHTAGVQQLARTVTELAQHGNAEERRQGASMLLEMQANLNGAPRANVDLYNDLTRQLNIDTARPLEETLATSLSRDDVIPGAREAEINATVHERVQNRLGQISRGIVDNRLGELRRDLSDQGVNQRDIELEVQRQMPTIQAQAVTEADTQRPTIETDVTTTVRGEFDRQEQERIAQDAARLQADASTFGGGSYRARPGGYAGGGTLEQRQAAEQEEFLRQQEEEARRNQQDQE